MSAILAMVHVGLDLEVGPVVLDQHIVSEKVDQSAIDQLAQGALVPGQAAAGSEVLHAYEVRGLPCVAVHSVRSSSVRGGAHHAVAALLSEPVQLDVIAGQLRRCMRGLEQE